MGHPPPSGPGRNRLAREASPYLREHASDPVDWYPWGAEALELARREDRPLLVSIGYSACHWCHVMQRESFADPATAELMNSEFVSIKVDREERPDLDRLYMSFLMATRGQGGWPLTVFCTPEGRPFYAGTYYPPQPRAGLPAFREVLRAVAEAYRSRRDEIEKSAERVIAALGTRPPAASAAPGGTEAIVRAAERLMEQADPEHGGLRGAPKFPSPPSLELLLAASDVLPPEAVERVRDHVLLTCREMARGGLFDQLGGGFHRYCVDEGWTLPHFEKMLYDQGLLLRVYAEASRRWAPEGEAREELAWPVRETVDFLQRELQAEDGGFAASLDAESEGEEGRFYLWRAHEIQAVLGAERGAAFCRAYRVGEAGAAAGLPSVLVDREGTPRSRWREERRRLLEARAARPRPATDSKRIAEWNAYAISGIAWAATVFEVPEWLALAEATADFVLGRMRDAKGRLLRCYDAGSARVPAFLPDLAAMLEACLDLFRAGGQPRFLEAARRLADDLLERFWDPHERDLLLVPRDGEPLVQRPRAEPDGATPSATALAGFGWLRLAALTGEARWSEAAQALLATHAAWLERAPEAAPTLARLAAAEERGVAVAVVVGEAGDPARAQLAAAARRSLAREEAVVVGEPGAPPAGIDPSWFEGRSAIEGRATAYLCRGRECSLPVQGLEAWARLCREGKPAAL